MLLLLLLLLLLLSPRAWQPGHEQIAPDAVSKLDGWTRRRPGGATRRMRCDTTPSIALASCKNEERRKSPEESGNTSLCRSLPNLLCASASASSLRQERAQAPTSPCELKRSKRHATRPGHWFLSPGKVVRFGADVCSRHDISLVPFPGRGVAEQDLSFRTPRPR